MKDLVIFVPCGAYKEVLDGLLRERRGSLGMRGIAWDTVVDTLRDSSLNLAALARPCAGQYSHALAIRDLSGSGWEPRGAMQLEQSLKDTLQMAGWAPVDCESIAVDPEIEEWLRIPSVHIWQLIADRARRNSAETADPANHQIFLRILARHGGIGRHGKPLHPKEVFEDLLRHYGIPRANALYGYLAGRESLQNCASSTFARLVQCLHTWFP